jgi:hypothetical protein
MLNYKQRRGKEGPTMLDRTGEWCFEGGCTYLTSGDDPVPNEQDIDELEDFYCEPCLGSYD